MVSPTCGNSPRGPCFPIPRQSSCFSAEPVEIAPGLWFAAVMSIAHALRVIPEIMRNLFARERLDTLPAPPRAERPRLSIFRALFAIEPLPLDPEPPAPPRRAGILRALLAPESLPEAPPAAPRHPRQRWLRWIFRPESLDPPP